MNEVKEGLNKKFSLARTERYACQSVAKKALPDERVSMCLRRVNGSAVSVLQHKQTSRAFYSGLMVCGSVWNCPVCAAKISEKRRKELKQAFESHKKDKGKIALLTLTFSHKRNEKLKDILDKFGLATQKFMSGRAFQNIRERMDLIGRIRVFEVTYGNNGFHPHAHIALFYFNDVDLKILKKEMYSLWEKACIKVGLTVNEKYGLDLQKGEEAEKYLSKYGTWSLDQELSKAHIKRAKKDSLTPFDFLRKFLEKEDFKYLALFKEYAECFKGKRQIQWSQGLKKRFLLEDKTDEQLVREKVEVSDLLGMLDYDTWKLILKFDNRSYFLDQCEKFGFDKALSNINIKNGQKNISSTGGRGYESKENI